ncbi:MAG: hypothetical protein Q9163_005667 [Psora crenata]
MADTLVHVVIFLCLSGVIICDVAALVLSVHYLSISLTHGCLTINITFPNLTDAFGRAFHGLVTALTLMDTLAARALATLQAQNSKSVETKLQHLTDLKQEIKHRQCPESAIPTIFHVIRISISTSHLNDAGFSILSHLTKRLVLQDQSATYHEQFIKLFPVLSERAGDQKERIRQRTIAALGDAYSVSSTAQKDVQQYVCGTLLCSKSPRMKESAMQFIVTMHEERGMLFRMFVPGLIDCCEDADGSVRMTAQNTIISLFKDAEIRARNDLAKRLEKRGVRKTIATRILSELASEAVDAANDGPAGHSMLPREPSHVPQASSSQQSLSTSVASEPPPEAPPMSVSEQEAVQLEPIYIESPRDLEETFREMHPWFEGKEGESNWLRREKSILKLRRITKGNAPHDYTTPFLANIKTLLDGILKTVNSLRTTVCTIGCHLIQDLARVCGSGLDNMVEILLQNLIKLCGNTKKISATKANDTVTAIMANVSYHLRLLQHIHNAMQDKNVQPRTYGCGWLKTILIKHGHSKNSIEHSGGVDLIGKSITVGLNDGNPSVRENMRPVYWVFAAIWPERSETIMSGLSQTHQDMLVKNPANPRAPSRATHMAATGGKSSFSQSTGAVPARPSIRDTIAAQKRAKAVGKNLPERPGSAGSFASPEKSMAPVRPATALSHVAHPMPTQSTGTLSSAPVRPRRRADNPRQRTADALAKKPAKAETPVGSPTTSPTKTKPKTPVFATSVLKSAPKKVSSPSLTTPEANSSKKLSFTETSPTKAAEGFTMVIPSLKEGVFPPNLTEEISNNGHLPPGTAVPSQWSSRVLERKAASNLDNTAPDISEHASNDGRLPLSTTATSRRNSRMLERRSASNLGNNTPNFTGDLSDHGARLSSTTAPPQWTSRVPRRRSISNLDRALPPSPFNAARLRSMTSSILADVGSHMSARENEHWPREPRSLDSGLSAQKKALGRISMSPRSIVGRKENMRTGNESTERRPLKVYEDPVDYAGGARKHSPAKSQTPRALEELPVNEPASLNRAARDPEPMVDWCRVDEDYSENKKTIGEADYRRSPSLRTISNPLLARRVLDSGIVRIRARSLDAHGFRKLQALWPSTPESIWEEGYKFEELLTALLENLEEANDDTSGGVFNAEDTKRQILIVINLLLEHQRHYFDNFYPQALCAIVAARKHSHPSSRLSAGLEETAGDIVSHCDPSAPIRPIMDLLDVDTADETRLMGFHVLAELLHQCHKKNRGLSASHIERLGRGAAAHMHCGKPEIRRAVIDMIVELRYNAAEEVFWGSLSGLKFHTRTLITYFLKRHEDYHE